MVANAINTRVVDEYVATCLPPARVSLTVFPSLGPSALGSTTLIASYRRATPGSLHTLSPPSTALLDSCAIMQPLSPTPQTPQHRSALTILTHRDRTIPSHPSHVREVRHDLHPRAHRRFSTPPRPATTTLYDHHGVVYGTGFPSGLARLGRRGSR